MISVVLIDDQSLFRHAIAAVVDGQADMQVVGQASNGTDGLQVVADTSPDVVLLDLEMPGMDGLETARQLVSAHPTVRVIMLTVNDEDEHLVGALRAGARGYLLKDLHPQELFDQVRAVMRGETPISTRLVPSLVEQVRHSPASESGHGHDLSTRELEILRLAGAGHTNREIGRRLFITEGTVKNHVHNALRKLGLDNRTQATSWLASQGLLRPDDRH